MTFKIGDKVEWTSSAAGTTKTKQGSVIAVLPEGGMPRDVIRLEEQRLYKVMVDARSLYRNHESYLVSVPTKSGRGRPRLYWPRVSALKLVKEEEEGA